MVTAKEEAWLGCLPGKPDSHVLLRNISLAVQETPPLRHLVHLGEYVTTMLPIGNH